MIGAAPLIIIGAEERRRAASSRANAPERKTMPFEVGAEVKAMPIKSGIDKKDRRETAESLSRLLDEASLDLLTDHLTVHEKTAWMSRSLQVKSAMAAVEQRGR